MSALRVGTACALLLLVACGGSQPAANKPAPEAASPLAGEGGAGVASPGASAVQARGSASPDEAMYVEKCGMCHRQMGMGTVILARRQPADRAMLEQREDLTAELIRLFVRSGGGNMPRIPRGEVSDAQLEILSRHLVRKQP